jgi:hypothetical protein
MLVLAMEFSRGEPRERKPRRGEQAAGDAGIAAGAMLPENGTEESDSASASMQETKVFHRKRRSRNRIASDQLGVLGCNDPSRNSLERR